MYIEGEGLNVTFNFSRFCTANYMQYTYVHKHIIYIHRNKHFTNYHLSFAALCMPCPHIHALLGPSFCEFCFCLC